ncbi:MAG: alpha/beta hydrolase [Coprobacillus sp.]
MSYFNYQNKNIYYEVYGDGIPVVFLHGNTASSKMFELLLPLYQDKYQIILIDFLGYGYSDELEMFPSDLWYQEALQTVALLDYLNYKEVNLIGTSGGAWVAIHIALERPDLVSKVVADSFDGRTLHAGFIDELIRQREEAVNNEEARYIYEWWLGENWRSVVHKDTDALIRFVKENKEIYHKSLTSLTMPILLIASLEDSLLRKNIEDEYSDIIQLVNDGKKYIFNDGVHPTILSHAEEFSELVKDFIE